MARRNRDAFSDGGTWKRSRDDGRGRSSRELQERASYDQQPKGGGILRALGRAFRGTR